MSIQAVHTTRHDVYSSVGADGILAASDDRGVTLCDDDAFFSPAATSMGKSFSLIGFCLLSIYVINGASHENCRVGSL